MTEKPEPTMPLCPSCNGSKVARLPEIHPESNLKWFKCLYCHHIWMVRDGEKG